MPKKAVVIGNCQVKSLALTLNYFSEDVEFDHFQVHSIAPGKAHGFIEKRIAEFADVDLVLTFNLSDKYYGLAADKIGETFADRPVLRINNLFFAGYHPDIIVLGEVGMRLDGALDQYHSQIALYAFLEGMSVDDAVALYRDDTYETLGFYSDWKRSARRMEVTDADVDLRFGQRYVEMLSTGLSMYVLNHPAPRVFYAWSETILADLEARGLATAREWKPDPSAIPNLFSETSMFPVYPEIASHHGLPFPGSYVFKGRGYGGSSFHSLPQFLEREFELFAGADRDALRTSRQWGAASRRFAQLPGATEAAVPQR
jgi:hypothetical protein